MEEVRLKGLGVRTNTRTDTSKNIYYNEINVSQK